MNIGETVILKNDPNSDSEYPTAIIPAWVEVVVKGASDAGVKVKHGYREATVERERLMPLTRIKQVAKDYPHALKVFEELWPELFGVIRIDVAVRPGEPVLAVNRERPDDILIRIHNGNKAFALNWAYDWKIETTEAGMLLIPKEPR
jgi:hypothetical protein